MSTSSRAQPSGSSTRSQNTQRKPVAAALISSNSGRSGRDTTRRSDRGTVRGWGSMPRV